MCQINNKQTRSMYQGRVARRSGQMVNNVAGSKLLQTDPHEELCERVLWAHVRTASARYL